MMCSCLTVFSWNWESEIYGRKTQFCSRFHLHLKRVCHHNIFFGFYIFFGPHFRITEFFFSFLYWPNIVRSNDTVVNHSSDWWCDFFFLFHFMESIVRVISFQFPSAMFSIISIHWNVFNINARNLGFFFLSFSFFLLSCHLGLMLDMGHIKGNWKLVHTYDECVSAKKWPWHSASGVDCVVAGI